MAAAAAARKRLAFDELWRLQMILVMRKRAVERESKGIRHVVDGEADLVSRFHATLPFPLTGAQVRAIEEIARDLAGPHPMHRLLQGDVGAGKTLVALTALLIAVQGGYQGALMAPTEVLAEQHYLGVRDLLSGLTVPDSTGSLFADRPVRVELLTNRTTARERERLAAALLDGSVDLLIGTHALLTEGVAFRSLGTRC
jgi:ATP-dependent DNA helicase RecG